jgi:hypothetical protein
VLLYGCQSSHAPGRGPIPHGQDTGSLPWDDVLAAAHGERFLAEVDASIVDVVRPSRLSRVLRRLWDGGPAPDPWPWAS